MYNNGKVTKADLENARLGLEALLKTRQINTAATYIEALLKASKTHQQIEALLAILRDLEGSLLCCHLQLLVLYAQALCQARRPDEILRILAGVPLNVELEVYKAWALVRTGEWEAALTRLEPLSKHAGVNRGLLWRTLGEARFRMGRPGWRESYRQARQFLEGTSLGRALLDEGCLLNESGERGAARACWAEALAHLRDDPYYLAWAHNSLGYSLVKDQPVEAERHLLEAVRLSKRGAAREFRCRALCGLGAVRRALGEPKRALSSYQEALKAPGDADDRQGALWGYGHTLRLLGQLEEALAALIEASQANPRETWIYADIAAVRLLLDDPEGARESLARVKRWGERSAILRTVVEAELLRRSGKLSTAKGLLVDLPADNLWVREELSCFPELRRYTPLKNPAQRHHNRIEVNPYGPLEVRVNGRVVPLRGKPGELLVFLLVHGGAASLEYLIDRLMKDHLKDKRKALWEHVSALRQALGWRESVQSVGRTYRLDPQAEWVCLEEPLPLGSREFMHGYYADWIEERRVLVI